MVVLMDSHFELIASACCNACHATPGPPRTSPSRSLTAALLFFSANFAVPVVSEQEIYIASLILNQLQFHSVPYLWFHWLVKLKSWNEKKIRVSIETHLI
uniref:(northern house mosquito) hypothetical protein n=1 Tax=Culex pipiens TaxID=7175 RepID=A0A8D8GLX5_CULPI